MGQMQGERGEACWKPFWPWPWPLQRGGGLLVVEVIWGAEDLPRCLFFFFFNFFLNILGFVI